MAFDFNSTTNKNYLQTINPSAPDAGAALKVLSLNLPNFLGGSPIAPDALLRPGLSTNAMVGGTPAAPPPTPAGSPVAGQSDALAGLSAQLGSPTPDASGGAPSPSSPTSDSPFATTSAPLASLASSALGGGVGAPVNNFAPPDAPPSANNFAPQTAPAAPYIQYDVPSNSFDNGTVTSTTDTLTQLLQSLFQPQAQGNDAIPDSGPQLI